MPISGNLGSAGDSAILTPSATVSELVVSKKGGGTLTLMGKAGSIEEVVMNNIGSGIVPVSTSDPAITYFLRAKGQNIDFDYYMGP